MLEWWNDIRMLCARYLVASEQVERTGPVEAAVRSVGYASEEEEESGGEEEEVGEEGVVQREMEGEGSSVEEEEEVPYQDAEDNAPPGYTIPEKHYPMEIGPNGYVVRRQLLSPFYPLVSK